MERAAERKATTSRTDASSTGRGKETLGRYAGFRSQTRLWKLDLRPVTERPTEKSFSSSFKPLRHAKLVVWPWWFVLHAFIRLECSPPRPFARALAWSNMLARGSLRRRP